MSFSLRCNTEICSKEHHAENAVSILDGYVSLGTTEGTPISPVMEKAEELAQWLVDNEASAFAGNTASYEGWLATIHQGFAPAMMHSGGKFYCGVEAMSWDQPDSQA